MNVNLAQSTRLFPKGKGAAEYKITGIAAKCDRVILSDRIAPDIHDVSITGADRFIFLSLRNHRAAFSYFARKVLPTLRAPFVLISGSEDVTTPNQVDQRWPQNDAEIRAYIAEIVSSPLLRRWWCENLDEAFSNKVRPFPLGLVDPDRTSYINTQIDLIHVAKRDPRAFCAHREREGAQWQPRRDVAMLAAGVWKDRVHWVEDEIPLSDFIRHLETHAFAICVEGGGLDPSPKAWLALQHGCIPIMRSTPTARAYEDLPVLYVPNWSPHALQLPKGEALVDLWEDAFVRNKQQTLFKLTLDYWWDKIRTD